MASKKKRVNRKNLDKEMKDVVKTLKSNMITALDIKEASKQLGEKIRKMQDKEVHLKELIGSLKSTRDNLYKELENTEKRCKELGSKISDLKDDKAGLVSENLALGDQIKNMKKEREEMETDLQQTNDMLVELKSHILEFDKEIKR